MGLNDLVPDDAGDAKGGRPKERGVGESIEPAGKPYLPTKDSEEWWLDVLDDVAEKEPVLDENSLDEMSFHKTVEVIGSISDYVSLHPVYVRQILIEHDIYDTDWSAYIDFFNDDYLDSRVPGYGKDKDDYEPEVEENPWKTEARKDSSSSSFGSSNDDKEGGLHNLVD
jgi:hypothetical protein